MSYLSNRLSQLPGNVANVLRILNCSSSQVGYAGWLGHRNLGDEALFQAISTLLSPATLFPYMPTPLEIRLLRSLKSNKTFRAICLGGGTLIGSLPYLRIIQDALSHNIPVFSFGTGVLDPSFRTDVNLYFDQWVEAFSQFEEVSVRGHLSADLLKQFGLKNVTVVGDPVLSFAGDILFDAGEDLVLGVNVGHPLEKYIWASEKDDIIGAVARNLKSLATKGWRFRLFSVVPDDEPNHRQLAELVGSRHIECSKLYEDPYEFISDAGKCCVFLGMKLHATILAYTAFTPIIMLEYQPKCRDFMHTTNRMDYNIRMDRITSSGLADLVEQCRSERSDLRHQQILLCKDYKMRLQSFANRIISKMGFDIRK